MGVTYHTQFELTSEADLTPSNEPKRPIKKLKSYGFNLSTQEAEPGGLQWVQGQPGQPELCRVKERGKLFKKTKPADIAHTPTSTHPSPQPCTACHVDPCLGQRGLQVSRERERNYFRKILPGDLADFLWSNESNELLNWRADVLVSLVIWNAVLTVSVCLSRQRDRSGAKISLAAISACFGYEKKEIHFCFSSHVITVPIHWVKCGISADKYRVQWSDRINGFSTTLVF